MAKKRKAKKRVTPLNVLLVLAGLVLLSVLLPALFPNATGVFGSFIGWFILLQLHFSAYWMFYSFAAAIVIAYLTTRK